MDCYCFMYFSALYVLLCTYGLCYFAFIIIVVVALSALHCYSAIRPQVCDINSFLHSLRRQKCCVVSVMSCLCNAFQSCHRVSASFAMQKPCISCSPVDHRSICLSCTDTVSVRWSVQSIQSLTPHLYALAETLLIMPKAVADFLDTDFGNAVG